MSEAVTPWDDAFTHILWRAQNAVHRKVQSKLDDSGVTATQLGLAVHLDELGPLSAADLSRGFHIAPQSVGTALNRLEKLDWVRRTPHPVYRRVVLYELTSTGQAGVAYGRQTMADVNDSVTSGLTSAEVAQLIRLLCTVTGQADSLAS
ncbi:MarR family winged helix-turn-helix transcriptional regulator [Streptomyces sp. NPDC059785]|uniref:MarR family winged helix-turn-helix transcriptional regulator n=1 Tax=Streptomyces sp. NPDC059785 TaxID=3346945 RepID=UPI0036621B0B